MGLFSRLLGRPTPDDFAVMMIGALRAVGDRKERRYDPERFRLVMYEDGQPKGDINLANIYRQYQETPRTGRRYYLSQTAVAFARGTRELPSDYAEARDNLRPKLWSRGGLAQSQRQGILDGRSENVEDFVSFIPVGEHLLGTVAYDWPESTQTIPPEQFTEWGISIYEAMEAARENLAAIPFGRAILSDEAKTARLTIFQHGDTYDASRLLLVDVIRDLPVKGRHVAMVPDRSQLFLTGSDDDVGLKMMVDLGERCLNDQSYGLSLCPLNLDDDIWVDWMPPADHPLYQRFRELKLRWMAPDYTEQKESLDKIHERQGIDIFVASYTIVESRSGRLTSYCVWADGADSLLPETDWVVLVKSGHDGPVASGPWERVRKFAGHLIERTEEYPPRWRVRGFPGSEARAQIGQQALPE